MSPSVFFLVIVFLVVGYAWYALYTLRNKCICVYTSPSKQETIKLVPLTDRHVRFGRRQFDITPERARFQWKQLLGGITGTWMVTYHFVWYSRYPEDPNEYGIVTMSPEVRHAMNQEEKFRAYNRAERERGTKAKGGWQQYLPWIALIAVVIVGFMVYNQGQQISNLQQMVKVPKP